MSTNHLSIEDSEHTLPDGGVNFFAQSFTAPGHDGGSRPFLSFRVTPTVVPVELQIDLNGTVIVNETFQSGTTRSINEIFDTSDLNTGSNDLVVSRVGNTGSIVISDLILCYSVPS